MKLRPAMLTLLLFASAATSEAQNWQADDGLFNPSGIPSLAFSQPRLADLDGDGDFDLILGSIDDAPLYFENIGTAASPAFAPGGDILAPIDPLDAEMAVAGDLDGDVDLDLVTGGYLGLQLFANVGDVARPGLRARRRLLRRPASGLDPRADPRRSRRRRRSGSTGRAQRKRSAQVLSQPGFADRRRLHRGIGRDLVRRGSVRVSVLRRSRRGSRCRPALRTRRARVRLLPEHRRPGGVVLAERRRGLRGPRRGDVLELALPGRPHRRRPPRSRVRHRRRAPAVLRQHRQPCSARLDSQHEPVRRRARRRRGQLAVLLRLRRRRRPGPGQRQPARRHQVLREHRHRRSAGLASPTTRTLRASITRSTRPSRSATSTTTASPTPSSAT